MELAERGGGDGCGREWERGNHDLNILSKKLFSTVCKMKICMSYSERSHLGHHFAASDRGSSHAQISRVQSVKTRGKAAAPTDLLIGLSSTSCLSSLGRLIPSMLRGLKSPFIARVALLS